MQLPERHDSYIATAACLWIAAYLVGQEGHGVAQARVAAVANGHLHIPPFPGRQQAAHRGLRLQHGHLITHEAQTRADEGGASNSDEKGTSSLSTSAWRRWFMRLTCVHGRPPTVTLNGDTPRCAPVMVIHWPPA